MYNPKSDISNKGLVGSNGGQSGCRLSRGNVGGGTESENGNKQRTIENFIFIRIRRDRVISWSYYRCIITIKNTSL